ESSGKVITNQLNNEIKYGNDKKIIVGISRRNEKVICSVKDSGIGIAKDQQAKIFEKFYRASGKNLHTYPGLGLGLYLSKEIIEKHNEKIWVESDEAQGAVFQLSLL